MTRGFRGAVIVVVAAAVAGGGAFWVTSRQTEITTQAVTAQRPQLSAPVQSPSPPPLSDVARDALSRTVTVEVVTSSQEQAGTAWLYDTKGDFVTNAHVLANQLSVRIRDRTGGTHVGVIVGLDAAADVAVVRSADGFAGAPLPVAARAAASGDSAVVIASSRATGHDDVTAAHVDDTVASVSSNGESGTDPAHVYVDMIAMSGPPIYQGNSGGPLLNTQGQVVGMVTLTSRTHSESYAIPIARVVPVVTGMIATAH